MEKALANEQNRSFENLACYQLGLKMFQAAYKLAEKLPAHERYNLIDQLRRAALSILLNIAEGYGRYHYLDKLRFFFIARGSLCETLSAFIAAHTDGYIDEDQLTWARNTENEAEKALNGYVNFIRKQQIGSAEYGNKAIREDEWSEYNSDLLRRHDQQDNNPGSLIANPRSPTIHRRQLCKTRKIARSR
jgi:four helix bundle protein